MIRTHTARALAATLLSLILLLTPGLAIAQPTTQPRPGDPVIVRLATGESIYGQLVTQTQETLILRVAGVETTIQNTHVERVTLQRTPLERYRSMRAIIDDTDTDRLLLLIDWLIQQELLTEARAELDLVLASEPTNPDARRTSAILNQRIVLRDRSNAAQPSPNQTESDPERTRATPPGRFEPGAFPLLTNEQINLLKVYELDLQDPPRLLIDRDTVSRFLNEYAGAAGMPRTEVERKDFLRKPPAEILELMFRLRARELYPSVRVLDLPTSLAMFRDNVAGGWLARSCASTSCHGGTDAPPPHLYNKRPFSETSALTNFIILDRFRFPDGSPMIDYERPMDSALLQLALPSPDSARPHPDVPGWRPAFRSRDARRFGETIDWINTMIQPRPKPPIDYEPPTLKQNQPADDTDPTTQPAEDQPPVQQPR